MARNDMKQVAAVSSANRDSAATMALLLHRSSHYKESKTWIISLQMA
jgi:hypothetical protein